MLSINSTRLLFLIIRILRFVSLERFMLNKQTQSSIVLLKQKSSQLFEIRSSVMVYIFKSLYLLKVEHTTFLVMIRLDILINASEIISLYQNSGGLTNQFSGLHGE